MNYITVMYVNRSGEVLVKEKFEFSAPTESVFFSLRKFLYFRSPILCTCLRILFKYFHALQLALVEKRCCPMYMCKNLRAAMHSPEAAFKR